MKTALLGSRGAVRISGPDALEWLQGLVTNDVAKADGDSACFAALLSPQGKVLFDFLIIRQDEQQDTVFYLDCAASQSAALAKRLSMYRLRAKVQVDDVSADMGVMAFWDNDTRPSLQARRDPRHPAAGWRLIGARRSLGLDFPPTRHGSDYNVHRISLGIPDGGADFESGEVFPHDVNMDEINGVDFKKGCYVGQEVVSRVQHRGSARKRIRPVSFEATGAHAGGTITAGEQTLGHVTSAAGLAGLALIRIDKLADAEAAGEGLRTDDIPLRVTGGR